MWSALGRPLLCWLGLHDWRVIGPTLRVPRTRIYYAECGCARQGCYEKDVRRV